jgi:succinate dehydrogenase / fumarate reductase membrane anchor subunit
MATTAERQSAAGEPAGSASYRGGRERPAGGLELWSWLFMRISGIVLLFLAVGHVLIMHVFGGGVSRVNFKFVELRWQSPFWRTWDWMMLSLALLHGVNGLRSVIMDYVTKPGLRFALNMFFYTLTFTLFVLGTVIVFTFNPAAFPQS